MKPKTLLRRILVLGLLLAVCSSAGCADARQSASKTPPSGIPSTPTDTTPGQTDPGPSKTPAVTPTPSDPAPTETPTSPVPTVTPTTPADPLPAGTVDALYLGVRNYGGKDVDKAHIDALEYRFFAGGEERFYRIGGKSGYALQNLLIEGELFRLTVDNDLVTGLRHLSGGELISGIAEKGADGAFRVGSRALPEDAKAYAVTLAAGGAKLKVSTVKERDGILCAASNAKEIFIVPAASAYTPPVSGTPGVKTIKNLFKTALAAVGSTLYIYGGGWDFHDEGSGAETVTIGLSPAWHAFFERQDENYTYKNETASRSYYPFGSFNAYHYAGLDCSGYLGWVLYNATNTASGGEGFVTGSAKFAKKLADRGWGSFRSTIEDLRPGEIVSLKGHVYLVLGTCGDGSVVILHSTASDSKTGSPGGGVQISAIGSDRNCEAYKLASEYMARFFPEWSKRYEVKLCAPSIYLAASENGGVFTFGAGSRFTDPDGYKDLSPEEILKDLFA